MEECQSPNCAEHFYNLDGSLGHVKIYTMPAFRLRKDNPDEVSMSTEDAGKEVDCRAKRRMAGQGNVTYQEAVKMELEADPALKKAYCQI